MVRIDLRSEIDTHFETIERISKEDLIKVLVFYTSNQSPLYNQHEEMTLYGVCEVGFDKLFANFSRANRINTPRTLTGWYNIYEPEDGYMTVGQIKVE